MRVTIPTKKWQPYIERFEWYDFADDAGVREYPIFPLGLPHLIIQLDRAVVHKTSFSAGWVNRPHAFVGGPFENGYLLKIGPSTRIFSVVFKPGKLGHFIAGKVSEYKNRLVPLDVLWGSAGVVLAAQFMDAKNDITRVETITRFLSQQWKVQNTAAIEHAAQQLMDSSGLLSIRNIRAMTNYSTSHFRKRFTEEIGLSPKQMQKIIRINALTERIKQHGKSSFTNVAYEFGYFDQAHFIKDFQAIIGMSPSIYFKNVDELTL